MIVLLRNEAADASRDRWLPFFARSPTELIARIVRGHDISHALVAGNCGPLGDSLLQPRGVHDERSAHLPGAWRFIHDRRRSFRARPLAVAAGCDARA